MQVSQTSSRIPNVSAVVKIPVKLNASGKFVRLADAAREFDVSTATLSRWATSKFITSKSEGSATFLDEGETKTIVSLHKRYGKRAGRMFRERGFIHLSQAFPVQLPPELRVS